MKERSKIDAYGDNFCPPQDTPEQMEACKHCSLPMRMCMGLADPEKCKAAYLAPGQKGVRHSIDYTYQIRTVEEMYDAVVRPLLGLDDNDNDDDEQEPGGSPEWHRYVKTRPLKKDHGKTVIERLRREKGVSQAAMANHLGLSLTQVSRYCTGAARTATTEYLQKIADYFGVDIEEIAG